METARMTTESELELLIGELAEAARRFAEWRRAFEPKLNEAADTIVHLSDEVERVENAGEKRRLEIMGKLDAGLSEATLAIGEIGKRFSEIQLSLAGHDQTIQTLSDGNQATGETVAHLSQAQRELHAIISGLTEKISAFDGLRVQLEGIPQAVVKLEAERGQKQAPDTINPAGQWEAGRKFRRFDLVTHLGSSWLSLADGNDEPPNRRSRKWQLIAARGAGGGGGGGGGASTTAQDFQYVSAPAGPTATGTKGQKAWDGIYMYECTAANTWVRDTRSASGWGV